MPEERRSVREKEQQRGLVMSCLQPPFLILLQCFQAEEVEPGKEEGRWDGVLVAIFFCEQLSLIFN